MPSETLEARTKRGPVTPKGLASLVLALAFWPLAGEGAMPVATELDAYLKPFVVTNNFSGSVLVKRGDTVLFERSYGFADRTARKLNRSDTRFHVASISILFTSTAVLRLIDQGRLSFDTHVSEIVPGIPNGDRITVRELLEQNSGLPDANDDLPDYDLLLKSHQTPESVVAAIRELPPHSDPGGKSLREEHSGQNLLALIIERKTGLSFAQAMKTLVFDAFGMRDSGVDDDGPLDGPVAQGYQVSGTFGLKRAPVIHWSAKPGNGSAYTTVRDAWKWIRGVRRGPLLSEASRKAMLETTDGYGWERDESARLGGTVYFSNGRAPGFSSVMEYMPDEDLAIIIFTNIEHDQNPVIVPEVAALLRGKPYEPFRYAPVPAAVVGHPAGDFVFGPDFYRPSATLKVVSDANGVTLLWPGGPVAPLLPIARDSFLDRYYWTDASLVRDEDGNAVAMNYGKFRGVRQAVPR